MGKRILGWSAVLAFLSVPRLLGDPHSPWMPSSLITWARPQKRTLPFPELKPESVGAKGKRKKKRGGQESRRRLMDQDFVDAVADLPRAADGGFWDLALADLRAARPAAQGGVKAGVLLPSFKRGYSSTPRRFEASNSYAPGGRSSISRAEGAAKPAAAQAGSAQARPTASSRSPQVDYDGGSPASGGAGFTASDSGLSIPSLSLASSKAQAALKDKSGEARPLSPGQLLGEGALKPPKGELEAPSLSDLKDLFPEALPDGRPYNRATPSPSIIEKLEPPESHPDYERWLTKDEHRRRAGRPSEEAHWHQEESSFYFHIGKDWAAASIGHWAWFRKKGPHWWSVADGAERILFASRHWWWKTEFGWLPVRDGRPAGLKRLLELQRGGWLGKDPDIAFSADLSRLAVTADDGRRQAFPVD